MPAADANENDIPDWKEKPQSVFIRIPDASDTVLGVPVATAHPFPVTVVAGGGGATTIADGADVAQGALADQPVAAPTTSGTLASVMRSLWRDFLSYTGGLTETAPATDTASSGLNGRLQRIAQRLTTLIALVPTSLGSNGGFKVEGVASGTAVPVSGTLTAVTTVTALTGGGVAHDGVDSGNPVKVGGYAVSAERAAVANADRTDFVTDLVGKLITLPYANPENFVSGAITSAMTGTTSTSLIAAPASGLRNYITQITVSNSHATVGTDVVIQDGNGGTTLYTIPAAAVYGGAVLTFPVPLRQPTTATAIYCANVTTGASTKVSASGYKGV